MPWLADPQFRPHRHADLRARRQGRARHRAEQAAAHEALRSAGADEARRRSGEAIGDRSRCCAAAPCTRIAASCCIVRAANGTPRHKISESIQVTTSRDVLAAMARGEGPDDAFIALGYAGWEAGQLEREIHDNAWLTLPVDEQRDVRPALRGALARRLAVARRGRRPGEPRRRTCLSRAPAHRPRVRLRTQTHRHRQRRHGDRRRRAPLHGRPTAPRAPTGARSTARCARMRAGPAAGRRPL